MKILSKVSGKNRSFGTIIAIYLISNQSVIIIWNIGNFTATEIPEMTRNKKLKKLSFPVQFGTIIGNSIGITNKNNRDMMNNTKAEMIVKLLNSLRHNELTIFTFVKKDGSKRVAYGTLKRDTFERMGMGFDKYDKARAQKPEQSVLVYWDYERGAFRSFVTENFCEYEGFVSINEEHTSRRIIAEVSKGVNPRIKREMLKDLTMEFGGDVFPMPIGKCEGFGIEVEINPVESKPIAGGVAGTMEYLGSIAVPKMPKPSVPARGEVKELKRVPTTGVADIITELLAGLPEGGKVEVEDLTELLVKVYCEGVRKGAELASTSK